MNSLRSKLVFAALPALLLVLHLVHTHLGVDTTTIALLVFMYLPWLADLVVSMEMPGVKVNFRDVQKLGQKITKAKLKPKTKKQLTPEAGLIERMSKTEPRLALSTLSVNLEGLLRELAVKASPEAFVAGEFPTLAKYIAILEIKGILPSEQADVLFDVLNILNHALTAPIKTDVAEAVVREVLPVFVNMQAELEKLNNQKQQN